ncbi:SDR family oxidoreductase [Tetragenococcus halophilus]|uniref:SDR family NAD(P)-dependent oxidoreductase n=3 Tax=Tetragenococcus halophilus TaxID=51669 RepID=A0A3G5FJ63_TETHA|nr:SDR family NAD(P)-dependent oxidoreductase [Tetragenococcus halophilus]AOF48774.1 short-chain dehydrogenase [Tetragenococcus halophilus]AYW50374.1 SDR family NAD(P)-dependent oxidoreductase [Tetragenococcus halophilus]MCF1601198.1 SDR family oxidoreductase [Tetragenococcus halophilus]MCF1684510.1 SDR family oxidoreductase [Tetragenococcus halophilus]MCO7025552.1 SDR family oxidoreductase [Tetragenococcus halophilus]
MNLKNKVILVTGASSGLGEQICYEAAKRGAIIIVCARRIQLIGQVKEKCKQLSQNEAYAFQLDVSDPDSIERMYERVKQEVGAVDCLVNDAGFGHFDNFVSFEQEKIREMFEVNVLGLMLLTQRVASDMLESKRGHIINIASMAGKMATPKSSIYSATKFAVLGFSNALRLELKPFGIAVTTVNPGPIRTEFFDKADPSGNYLENVDAFVIKPNKLAHKIVKQISRPKREINQPAIMEFAARAYQLFPKVGDFLAAGIFNQK